VGRGRRYDWKDQNKKDSTDNEKVQCNSQAARTQQRRSFQQQRKACGHAFLEEGGGGTAKRGGVLSAHLEGESIAELLELQLDVFLLGQLLFELPAARCASGTARGQATSKDESNHASQRSQM